MTHAALNVFACEPEYAALVKELAPDAKVYSATTALQDPHHIQARPSLIAKMRRADLVVCAGADLEIGWLPVLQMKAANARVRDKSKGLFFATEQVETLDKLDKVDRSMGDVHEKGNPHVHFDPNRLLLIAKALMKRLSHVDPSQSVHYHQQYEVFEHKWQQAITRWQQKAIALQGKNVIAYHSSFRYLFKWLQINQVDDLEPKPGLAPTTSHLAQLLKSANNQRVTAVILTSYQDTRGGEWLSKRAKIPMVVLPMSIGGNDDSQDLFSLYDSVINLLLESGQ
ncbi:zinc ABC transporter substrate-binding protein [Parashewanella spongiae]|uniref:Zinc ABC transporter substrate-binding protein n=2 Tax=Parashewanella spongiae TaxID=342950 RepID=A0A3A6U8T4_9GAMM|nr:zinc ABC transporter substrate-binding protein [Parashewanella spongiae]